MSTPWKGGSTAACRPVTPAFCSSPAGRLCGSSGHWTHRRGEWSGHAAPADEAIVLVVRPGPAASDRAAVAAADSRPVGPNASAARPGPHHPRPQSRPGPRGPPFASQFRPSVGVRWTQGRASLARFVPGMALHTQRDPPLLPEPPVQHRHPDRTSASGSVKPTAAWRAIGCNSVSYTHLTLPTIYSV